MAATEEPYSRLQDPDDHDGPADNTRTQEQQREKPRNKYKSTLHKLGVSEVAIGSLSILLAIVTIIEASKYSWYIETYYSSYEQKTVYYNSSYHHALTYSGQGIWSGAILLVSGILGINAKGHPSVCMYNTNMALSIVAAVVTLTFCVMSAIAAGNNVSYYQSENRIYSLIALHSILAILAFAGGVVCIVHSAYCCRGVCCRRQSYTGGVAYYAHPQSAQQTYQMVQLQNGQFILIPYQHTAAASPPVVPAMYQPTQVGMPVGQVAMAAHPSAAPTMYQPTPANVMPLAQIPLRANQYPTTANAMQSATPPAQPASGKPEQE